MSRDLPRRGPRVVHGMAAMLAQARALPALQGPTAAPQQAATDKEAQEALNALVERLVAAEGRVDKARRVIAAFRDQCAKQPEGSPLVAMVSPILDTLEAALK